MNKEAVLNYLNLNEITYALHEHLAVFTCAEAKIHCKDVFGIPAKSLLVKAGEHFYLCIVPADKKLNSKKLEDVLKVKKIRFANPEELMQLLRLTFGSVSPFGLLNDKEHKVKLIIDELISRSEYVQFHPNVNTATLVLSQEQFCKFLASIKTEKKTEKIGI